MAIAKLGLGQNPNDGTGDPLRTAGAKLNQVIDRVNGLDFQRVTNDYEVQPNDHYLDCFPDFDAARDITITLKPKSEYGDEFYLFIPNNTATKHSLNVESGADSSFTKQVAPKSSYFIYFNATSPDQDWDAVAVTDHAINSLDVVTFGNLNSIAWSSVPTARYIISGNFQDFAGLPPDFTAGPATPITLIVDVINQPNLYRQHLVFLTGYEPQNDSIGRPSERVSLNFGGATGVAWATGALTRDLAAMLESVYADMGKPIPSKFAAIMASIEGE